MPEQIPNQYTNVDDYNRALSDWEARYPGLAELTSRYKAGQLSEDEYWKEHDRVVGGLFPRAPWNDPMRQRPSLSEGGQLQQELYNRGYDSSTPSSDAWQRLARDQTSLPVTNYNPFRADIADQSRDSQLELLRQMQLRDGGPSVAALQGQQAMSRLGQTTLGNAAAGNSRAALLGGRNAASGIVGDVAQARLQEALRARASQAGLTGGVRGADIRTQGTAAQSGLQNIQQQLANRLAFAGLGARQANIQDQSRLELLKAMQRADLEKQKSDRQALKWGIGTAASSIAGVS